MFKPLHINNRQKIESKNFFAKTIQESKQFTHLHQLILDLYENPRYVDEELLTLTVKMTFNLTKVLENERERRGWSDCSTYLSPGFAKLINLNDDFLSYTTEHVFNSHVFIDQMDHVTEASVLKVLKNYCETIAQELYEQHQRELRLCSDGWSSALLITIEP